MSFRKFFLEHAKSIAFQLFPIAGPRYPYILEPIQLALLVNELDRLDSVPGNVVEIGVSRGMTTMFLCQHITSRSWTHPLKYIALDTFNSFVKEHLEYETSKRGKNLTELKGFPYKSISAWTRNFRRFPFVKAIEADCATFDYTSISPIKLALLDVDLYVPTHEALPKLFSALAPDGVIVVDDVKPNNRYDGAYQAYIEFCQTLHREPLFVGNKCGLIYKTSNGLSKQQATDAA